MTRQRGSSFILVSDDLVGEQRGRGTTRSATPGLAGFLGLANAELGSLAYRVGGTPILRPNHPPWALLSLGPATLVTALAAHGMATSTVPQSVLLRDHATDPVGGDVLAVGISTTFVFDPTLCTLLVTRARARWPASRIVLGGAGLTLNPGWFASSGADFAIVGDADEALPTLLGRIAAGNPTADVPGLLWRDARGRVQLNPRHDVDLNTIPTPRYDLVTRDGTWPTHVLYETIRGCPFRCRFCSYPQQSPNWRVKSAAHMVEDFVAFAAAGVRHVCCHDSTMLTPASRMRELTRLLIERRLELTWDCMAHPTQIVDDAFAEELYAAGCRAVYLGVESGSEVVLRNMRKQTTRAQAIAAGGRLMRAGIAPWAFFVLGFPGETPATAEDTFSLIQEMPLEAFRLQPFEVRDARIPLLAERERFGFKLHVVDGEVVGWEHPGMDSSTAQVLTVELHVRLADGPGLAYSVGTTEQAGWTRNDHRNPDLLIRGLRKEYERYLHRAPEARAFGARAYKSAERAAEHQRLAREQLRAALDGGQVCFFPGQPERT